MTKEKPFDIELFFAALADKTRLRLLNLIGDDEVCVCFFVEVIGTNQPKISRHLAYLRRAGLVSMRKDWKWSHYRITEPKNEYAAEVFRKVREWIRDDKEMINDRREMVKICCAPAAKQPVGIVGAPKPKKIMEAVCC
ncbi:MAG TPA: metalloregulator ArsR/SmtB family transcription factor [Pyrinomonadaceae bacterium]|jgi:ArsR family transcriptional regulator|nr:metalloregulator ArsR/SmtB family transcription factor [Pyrinomonadaceae bacterium]